MPAVEKTKDVMKEVLHWGHKALFGPRRASQLRSFVGAAPGVCGYGFALWEPYPSFYLPVSPSLPLGEGVGSLGRYNGLPPVLCTAFPDQL